MCRVLIRVGSWDVVLIVLGIVVLLKFELSVMCLMLMRLVIWWMCLVMWESGVLDSCALLGWIIEILKLMLISLLVLVILWICVLVRLWLVGMSVWVEECEVISGFSSLCVMF